MDISYDNDETIRRCFTCDEPVISNLNVMHNSSNGNFIFWNKFQIFVYESPEFECASKVIVPEFQIKNFISSNNYLMCIDYAGNVHTTSLKFKNAAQKRFKFSFYPRENHIVTCALYNEEYAICLKLETVAYFLNVHKITTDFNLEKKVFVMCNEHLPIQPSGNKCILRSHPITENQKENLSKILKTEDIDFRNICSFVVISFDGINIYGCLFSTKMAEVEVKLTKLYTCPSEIANIDITASPENLNIIIGLTIGTLISLDMADRQVPKVIHLNTAIHKCSIYKNTILYTDGLSMWKAENILSKELNFSQFFIRNVKDFIKIGVKIICTTYNNLIYTFSIDDDRSYIKPKTTDEYCAAENLFDNSEYLKKILEEVKKNEELIKKQITERNYITSLSLSNRQDIMDNIIKQKIVVYENYQDAVSEYTDILLTNNFSEYFDKESFYFLIKLTVTTDHRLHEILSNSLGDLRVHVILISAGKIVKTTMVKVQDLTKSITLLVPLQNKYITSTEMRVDVKIMTNMPGALDSRQKIWAILYRKSTVLNCNYFININVNSDMNVCLKEPNESLEDLILHTARNQYGTLLEFSNSNEVTSLKNWDMYVRLPAQYHKVFKKGVTMKQSASKKVDYFLQKLTAEDFLRSKSDLTLSIVKDKVKIEIDNDGFSTPVLKISSSNVHIVLDIRNLLSDLIYSVFYEYGPGKEFINHSFYITVENLQKAIKNYTQNSQTEDIVTIIEQFERKVIGLLPI